MWIEGDETAGANTCVDGVCHESLTKAGDNKVIINIGERREIIGSLEALMRIHGSGRLAVHGVRPLGLVDENKADDAVSGCVAIR